MNKLNMLKPTGFLTKQILAVLCATPLLFSATQSFADEAPKEEMAAPAAEAAPATEAAAAAPAEPTPDWTFTLNLGLYSQYMFRGVALSDGPALQGGADIGHSSGFYAGTWWSNIDPDYTGNGDGNSTGLNLETDWYVGYAHTFENGFGVNVLGNYYWYPEGEKSFSSTNRGKDQDSFEASIAMSYKFLTYTYYRVLTDYYGASADITKDGTTNTKGAGYHELKVNYKLPVADLNFMTKVGYQNTPNLTASQGDFAIGLNRDFSLPSAGKPIGGFNAGGYYTQTFDVKDEAYYVTSSGRDTNTATMWFYLKRSW
jgi:uncharacterized protein (TIGR02001 family)